jgi:hypothetical protein
MDAAAVHQERYTQRMADGEAALLAKGMGLIARYKLEELEEIEE